ncbi:fluoride efflux transporter CrcB [Williamsia sterculiae]|uniref:Fluoride-specific ion channel FluC n=1 Tax=Williamsia sterculiae TaxID=1344003 RepID=A0A1N7F5N1_9NOCA|nr:fluoride efflux transporter CrcB [Williamsia sterculiae]SIR95566.1 camphor resistance protein CrcB [Williamsia sterculiae]
MEILAIVVAGAVGAVARFVVDSRLKARWGQDFPWQTLTINVSGSLLLGVLAGLVLFHGAPGPWQTIVGTGFCGGYTTFSTASFETVRLVQQRRHLLALGYGLSGIVVSTAACGLGLALVYLA